MAETTAEKRDVATGPTESIYDTPLWKVRRLGGGWYQGETQLWPAPTGRTRDFQEARRWIETQVERFLADNGYVRLREQAEEAAEFAVEEDPTLLEARLGSMAAGTFLAAPRRDDPPFDL